MSSRSEPLLWLQLVAIGAIPLELQLLRLILASSDLGPVPPIERLLCWGIAVIAPAVLFWKKPVDWGSLLLVRQRIAERNLWQRKISRLQDNLFIKLVGASGAFLLLGLFWWIDRSSLLVSELSPLSSGHRLKSLLISTPILAVIFWQWHQLVQTIWLLTRPSKAIDEASIMSDLELEQSRLSLGFSLLRLRNLEWDAPKFKLQTLDVDNKTIDTSRPEQTSDKPKEDRVEQEVVARNEEEPLNSTEATDSVFSGSIQPKQTPEEDNSTDLNHEITENNIISSSDPQGHDEQPKATGSEESKPDQTPESTPGSA